MRRLALIAGLLSLGFTAGFAQSRSWGQGIVTHGISPSVTSVTSSNHNPGIAPSVTSVTRAIAPTAPPAINNNRHRHHHNTGSFGGYYYYPYYPYDNSYEQYPADSSYAQPQQVVADQPEAPAPTIFENRPGYKPPPVQSETATNQAPAASDLTANSQAPDVPSEPEPSTILVFRDGHQLEIGNYVIVGNTLYNMSGAYRSYKIQLAELDLPATIKANEDRGIDFHVPVVTKKPA